MIGGIPELIEEGKTGELFESGNEIQLRTKIEQLWKDRALLERYSENCKKTKRLFVEQYTEQMLAVVETETVKG